MSFLHRYPLNVPGKFYIDDQCTDCDFCREIAPNNCRRDDRVGQSYVYKQPENEEEREQIEESLQGCPCDAIGSDGDEHDWSSEPIQDWNVIMRKDGVDLRFEFDVPTVEFEGMGMCATRRSAD